MQGIFTPAMMGFILALTVQIVGFIWWAAKTAAAVSDLAMRLGMVETEQRTQEKSTNEMKVTMARLDERTEAIVKGQERIEKHLYTLGEGAK